MSEGCSPFVRSIPDCVADTRKTKQALQAAVAGVYFTLILPDPVGTACHPHAGRKHVDERAALAAFV